jgi:hypothetical protein
MEVPSSLQDMARVGWMHPWCLAATTLSDGKSSDFKHCMGLTLLAMGFAMLTPASNPMAEVQRQ